MATFVGIGFGPIQAGLFLHEAYRSGRFDRLVVAEVQPELVTAIRGAGNAFMLNIATAHGVERCRVPGVELFNPAVAADRAALVEAVTDASELATALPNIDFYERGVADLLAEGFRKRRDGAVVYAAENHNHAAEYLAKNKVGAIVVIERQVGLDGLVEGGTKLDATVTHELLKTIFWPGSALHDMAVVIRGNRIVAAGVQLPLAEAEQFSAELGSRHRAAYGLSQEADSLVVVVSEETGTISLAERGRLIRNLSIDGLRTQLVRGLGQMAQAESDMEEPADDDPDQDR